MAFKDGSKQRGGKAYRQHGTLRKAIRERDSYTCQLCGKEGWIVDHIISFAVSHDSTISNLRVLCHSCNLKLRRPRRDALLALPAWFASLERQVCANQ